MKLSKPGLSPLLAFFATVVLVFGYLLVFVYLVARIELADIDHAESAAVQLVLLCAPLVLAGCFYAWASAGTLVSPMRRWFQVGVAALLAPVIAASLLEFLWFVVLGRSL